MHEIQQGERYWFNDADERIMTESNREFELTTPEEQLFFRYFRPIESKDARGEWLSPAEIMNILRKYTSLPMSASRITYFGKILQKHKVPSKHTHGGTAYHVERYK